MLEAAKSYLDNRSPGELVRDFVDILVVYYVFYRLLLVARGTRAMQVAAGLAIVALLYVVAQLVGLVTIVALMGSLLQSIILVIVVVFQNDIRRALQRVGSRAIFGGIGRAQESEVIDQVVLAAGELARHRIGAIITFEQDANLDEFIGQNKGIELDAKVSAELLVSLFIPEGSNKLHDGAVVIRNLRIAKAGVFYPMPESRSFDPTFGSRHRAAIGITEETDAVVVVVSEERGTVSFCFNGNIASNLEVDQLREMLVSIMSPKVRKKSRLVQKRRGPSLGPRSGEQLPGEAHEDAPPPSSLHRSPGSTPPPPLRKASATIPPPPARELDQAPQTPKSVESTRPPAGDDSSRSPLRKTAGAKHSETKSAAPGSTTARASAKESPSALAAPKTWNESSRLGDPPGDDRTTQTSLEDSDDDSLRLRVANPARPMPRAKELEHSADPEDTDPSEHR